MNGRLLASLALLALLALGPATRPAQAQARLVVIEFADQVAVETDARGTVRRLSGGVRLRSDGTRLAADRAVHFVERGEVLLDGRVRIIAGTDTLTAARVAYDANTREAVATGSVRLGDGVSALFAPRASYNTLTEVAAFSGGGRLLHRGAVLTAPAGTYSTARRVADVEGPVKLTDSTGTLQAARGRYDANVQRADFAGAVRLRRSDARLDADSVVYFRRTERARAYGQAALERFGAARDVPRADPGTPPDRSRRTLLFGDVLLFDGQAETAAARGTPARDPLLVLLRTDSLGRTDTTLARAARLDAAQRERAVSEVAGARGLVPPAAPPRLREQTLLAAGGVRVVQRRLAAVADSVAFVRLEQDGAPPRDRLAVYGGDRRPSLWYDGAQLTADSLLALATAEQADTLRAFGRAFVARPDSALGRVQQIRGDRMLALLRDETLHRLSVWPRAEAVTYRADPDGRLAGADRLAADSLVFRFADGELRQVRGDRDVEGTAFGPANVPNDLRLEGYVFTPSRRPSPEALLDPDGWEAAWLRARAAEDDAPPVAGPAAAAGGTPGLRSRPPTAASRRP